MDPKETPEERRRRLLSEAIETWGLDAQLEMLAEECAELIVAIQHMKRNRVGWDAVGEEMADVRIMVDQISILDKISDIVLMKENDKLNRLEKRLNDKKDTLHNMQDDAEGREDSSRV